MMFESFLNKCPQCDQYYRGFLYKCPSCGFQLRPKPKISDATWDMVTKTIKKPETK